MFVNSTNPWYLGLIFERWKFLVRQAWENLYHFIFVFIIDLYFLKKWNWQFFCKCIIMTIITAWRLAEKQHSSTYVIICFLSYMSLILGGFQVFNDVASLMVPLLNDNYCISRECNGVCFFFNIWRKIQDGHHHNGCNLIF